MRHVTFTIDFDVPDDTPDDAIRDLAVDAWVQIEDPRDRDGSRLTFDVDGLGAVLAVGSGRGGFFDHFGIADVRNRLRDPVVAEAQRIQHETGVNPLAVGCAGDD